jgi:hypothetical protein
LSSKDIMEDIEDTKNEALESVVPKVIRHDNASLLYETKSLCYTDRRRTGCQ